MSVSRRLIAEEYAREDIEQARHSDVKAPAQARCCSFVGAHGELEDHDGRFAIGWFCRATRTGVGAR